MLRCSKFCFDIRASGPDLQFQVYLDQKLVGNLEPEPHFQTIVIDFVHVDDIPGKHEICFAMSGKLAAHTELDQTGQIINDRIVEIAQVKIDDINVQQTVFQNCVYTHDHNGSTQLVQHNFYGIMGCNGQVNFAFTSPIYLWLLENM